MSTLRRLRVRLAARLAYRRLRACGGEGVLVGTAGLLLRGYDVEVPDVDFLCRDEVVPGGVTANGSDGDGGPRALGLPVHYITQQDEGRRAFYHPEVATVVFGVLVAALNDILLLKGWAGRRKDREFLYAWQNGAFR